MQGRPEKQLEHYFTTRQAFFQKYPVYQRIFCEAVISPPGHLREAIQERKQRFDMLNIQILEELLNQVTLRPQVTRAEVIDTFRQFQDFINANDRVTELCPAEFTEREKRCRKALNILLYGVIDQEAYHD